MKLHHEFSDELRNLEV